MVFGQIRKIIIICDDSEALSSSIIPNFFISLSIKPNMLDVPRARIV